MVARFVRPVVLGTCVALAVAGCGGRSGDSATDKPDPQATSAPVPVYKYEIDNAATGPAAEIPGAATGGTVRVYDETDYQHLDPARIFTLYESTLSLLISRGLTGYRQQGTNVTLVGDLATDTGRTTDGGKTWTFTLRDGIAWEDGQPITADQVKYGLERTFSKDYADGPTYMQSWFADNPEFYNYYSGPYEGKSLDAISAPDEKTITLKFSKPRPDVPFAMAMPFSSPVRKDKDTRVKYTDKPFASGPYRIESRQIDKSMTLVRNTAWKPESDPIRTAYPDRFEFSFGERPVSLNQRLMGAAGDDAAGMTVQTPVSQEVLPQVLSTPELAARTVSGLTPGMSYVAINTKRITDLRVRKAIMYAYPRAQARQAAGGSDLGDFASTLSSPTLIGHEQFDLFDVPPEGDTEKAKSLLQEAGAVGQKIVHAYLINERNTNRALVVKVALEKAGFTVVQKPLPARTGFDEIQNPNNEFDMYFMTWTADWPSGATVFSPLFDGRTIKPGAYNVSFYNDEAVNAEIDRISAIQDPIEAGKQWALLERRILEQVPMFPDLYTRARRMHGPKIGNAHLDAVLGNASLNGIYVKP